LPRVDFEQFLEPIKQAETMDELRRAFESAYKKAESTGNNNNTEKAIKVKDLRKGAIQQNLKDNKVYNALAVKEWLKTQTSSFELIPNVSALEAILKTTRKRLSSQCEEYNIELEPMEKILKKQYNIRVELLNKTTEKK